MRYRLIAHGRVFSTRDRGARVLADLTARHARAHDPVIIDFAGVVSISYSFADEFVGEFMERAQAGKLPWPTLENLTPRSERIIQRSMKTRQLSAPGGASAPGPAATRRSRRSGRRKRLAGV